MVDCLTRKHDQPLVEPCSAPDVSVAPSRSKLYQLPEDVEEDAGTSLEQEGTFPDFEEQYSAKERFGLRTSLRGREGWRGSIRKEHRSSHSRGDGHSQFISATPTDHGEQFEVSLTRGRRGLGLAVEMADRLWADHIRVKRVFPHQPAAESGQIHPGDVILRVNQLPIRGLPLLEALNTLRLAGPEVQLTLVRPDGGATVVDSPRTTITRSPSAGSEAEMIGTFQVSLQKLNSSLGLSLRRSDDTVLGHAIKAKVREPALSDPRVKVGDRLVKVDGVDITVMSHAEAVSFLRRCGDLVTLTLYRDRQPTPGSPASPVLARSTKLRPEAVEMLHGLACRREMSESAVETIEAFWDRSRHQSPSTAPSTAPSATTSPAASRSRFQARKLTSPPASRRHDLRNPQQRITLEDIDDISPSSAVDVDVVEAKNNNDDDRKSLNNSDCVSLRDGIPPAAMEAGVTAESGLPAAGDLPHQLHRISETDADCQQTAAAAQDSWCESDSADSYYNNDDDHMSGDSDTELQERHLRRLMTEGVVVDYPDQQATAGLQPPSRTAPHYHSVQPPQRVKVTEQLKRVISEENLEASVEDGVGLIKWKGITLDDQHHDETDAAPADFNGQLLLVELHRGWSSRLGFSLHCSPDGGHVVSHIHQDSVAQRDGRLRVGDLLVKVNEELVQGMASDQVIDLLRKTRGTISLCVSRT